MTQGTVLFLKLPVFRFCKKCNGLQNNDTILYFRRKVKKYPHVLFGNTFFRFGHGVLPTARPLAPTVEKYRAERIFSVACKAVKRSAKGRRTPKKQDKKRTKKGRQPKRLPSFLFGAGRGIRTPVPFGQTVFKAHQPVGN